jgi:hypothetical protein
MLPEDDFYRSCSFKSNAPPPAEPPIFFKPEVYSNSRTDIDTLMDVLREVPKRHPRLLVIHLGDADEEAHLHARVAAQGRATLRHLSLSPGAAAG